MTSGGSGVRLIAVGTIEPSSPAATNSAVCTPARCWASLVEAPRCGMISALSNSCRGLSVHGSSSQTSMPAAKILPAAMKSASESML